jgi:hypothetical protein
VDKLIVRATREDDDEDNVFESESSETSPIEPSGMFSISRQSPVSPPVSPTGINRRVLPRVVQLKEGKKY